MNVDFHFTTWKLGFRNISKYLGRYGIPSVVYKKNLWKEVSCWQSCWYCCVSLLYSPWRWWRWWDPLHRYGIWVEFGLPKLFSKTFKFSKKIYSTWLISGGGHCRKAQGPTLAFEHKWNLTSQLDKLRLSSWLVTLASGPSSNHLTSDSLPSQLVKSTCMVTPGPKITPASCPKNPPRGVLGGGQVTVMWPKNQKRSLFNFLLPKFFSVKKHVLGIILRCSPPREAN